MPRLETSHKTFSTEDKNIQTLEPPSPKQIKVVPSKEILFEKKFYDEKKMSEMLNRTYVKYNLTTSRNVVDEIGYKSQSQLKSMLTSSKGYKLNELLISNYPFLIPYYSNGYIPKYLNPIITLQLKDKLSSNSKIDESKLTMKDFLTVGKLDLDSYAPKAIKSKNKLLIIKNPIR
jgi:hypothetical protein